MTAAVVNHLQFKEPVDAALFSSAEDDLARRMRDIEGFGGFRIVQVADDQVILLIFADSPDTLNRIATEVGSPWMSEHVVPLLARPPERRIGTIVASGEP